MGIIDGLFALGNTGMQIAGNQASNRANTRAQKRDQQYNERMWAKENAYNHPTQQMARLKDAGLNPHLIYGTSPSSAVGTAGSIAPTKHPGYKSVTEGLTPFTDYVRFKQMGVQNDNIEADTDVKEQESLNKALLGEGMTYENVMKKIDAGLHPKLAAAQLDAQIANTENVRAKTLNTESATRTMNALRDPQVAKAAEDALIARKSLEGKQLENELKRITLKLNKTGTSWQDNAVLRKLILGYDEFGGDVKKKAPELLGKYLNKISY